MEANTVLADQGLQLMDTEAVNDYLEALIKGKSQVEGGLEAKALNNFKSISGRVDQLHAAHRRAEAQVEAFKAEINQANGELKAYADMLASAEDARRMEDLRKTQESEDNPEAEAGPDPSGNGDEPEAASVTSINKPKKKTKAKPQQPQA